MSKFKYIVSTMIISLFAMTLVFPMVSSDGIANLTLSATIPAGHATHTPWYDNTFWVNTGTWKSPAWTEVHNWGGTTNTKVTDPDGKVVFDIKVPAIIRDSHANDAGTGGGHVFYCDVEDLFAQAKAQGATHCRVVDNEPPTGGISVSTIRLNIDPPDDLDITANYKHSGPKITVMRMPVYENPESTIIAMQTGALDVATDLIRTGDIEKLDADGFTITADPGFHMGYIGFNCRPDQSYRRTDLPLGFWPLADVQFRHALIHCYDQESIVASIYGYTVTPVQSLIPPSQGGWQYTQIRKHPYNPGNPLGTTIYNPATGDNEDSCSILRYAGYTFVDAGTTGVVDDADYWKDPNGNGLKEYKIFTPTEDTPTSYDHGRQFALDLGGIGLAATSANGWRGFTHEPHDFNDYMDNLVDYGDFDAFMVFWSLGRFPDHIYDMLHSSMDSLINPGMVNHPGVHDDEIDRLVTIVKTSLDHAEKLAAAHEVQRLLYEPEECSYALPYMLLYSRIYFNGFNPNLRGIVRSPGYGSDNGWTYMNLYWEPGTEQYDALGRTVVDWALGLSPEIFNPCYASTVYTWQVMDKTMDGLLDVNPYTHEDLPAMAEDWEIQKWAMEEDVAELQINLVTVTNESLGFGDGTKTTFDLVNTYVVSGSETVYLNNTATAAYTIDYTAGKITFTTAPSETTWINADYTYVYLLGADRKGSHWHEDWPKWGDNWYMTSWTDTDVSLDLTVGDIVDFFPDPRNFEVIDLTWDIKVEDKEWPNEEMKLSGTGAPKPPAPIINPNVAMPGTTWHEEYPVRSITWTCTGFTDNGDGVLSRSDQIQLGGRDYHVDSVTITIHLDYNNDDVIDKVMEFAGTGMKVLYWLRRDVFWQDGNPYTAEDAKFNLLFFRDNNIPRYTATWKFIDDVVTVGQDGEPHYKVVVYANVTSQFLLYDFAGLAAVLPPPVWEPLDGKPLMDILSYDASTTDVPVGAGPWFGTEYGPKTQLYGTGPYIFDGYDEVNAVAEIHQNPSYYRSTESISAQKTDMFHKAGDVNYDGTVWADDRAQMGIKFGMMKDIDPEYDTNVDVNSDDIIDILDISVANYFFGDQKEWP